MEPMPVSHTPKEMLATPTPPRVRISSGDGSSAEGSKRRGGCGAWWRNPQNWLMLAMCALAGCIFVIRIIQSRQVRRLLISSVRASPCVPGLCACGDLATQTRIYLMLELRTWPPQHSVHTLCT